VIEQEEATLDIVPKHVFVGEGFEGRMGGSSDEACLSSIEGVSVELDRKKEERKRAKQEAALGAVLNASLGELELRPCDKSAVDQRLNQSMSSVLKRPTLLRSDSGVSSLSFPPSDRRKRASKSQHSVEDHDLRIPDAIAIRCKPQDFTSLPQLRPHCISAVGGHCLDIVKSEFHSENTTEDDRRTPRWMNRLSIHSVLNTISREEVTEMKIWACSRTRSPSAHIRRLLAGVTKKRSFTPKKMLAILFSKISKLTIETASVALLPLAKTAAVL